MYSPEVHDALIELQYEAEGIELMLSTALAIRNSTALQNRFHLLAGTHERREVQITGLVPDCCLRFSIGKEFKVSRGPDREVPSVQFGEALERDYRLAGMVWEGTQAREVQTKARKLLEFFTGPALPIRSLVCELEEWSPLLEQFSYKYAARLIALLNALRPLVLSGPESEKARRVDRYWTASLIAGRAILFASNAEVGTWLSGMATCIRQSDWTPSLPLMRERSLWLACCGAKSAAKFGSAVIDRYFDVLGNSRSDLVSFDSLFGLVAIGLEHSNEGKAIAGELARLVRKAKLSGQTSFAAQEALRHLSGQSARRGANPDIRVSKELTTTRTLFADPMRLEGGKFVGFEILPSVISAKAADLFPATEHERATLMLSPYEAERVFRRAWSPEAEPALAFH